MMGLEMHMHAWTDGEQASCGELREHIRVKCNTRSALNASADSASNTTKMLRLLQRTLPARRGYLLCANVHASSENIDAELRSNVRLLGKTLGDSINQYNPKAFAVVEELRMLGREVSLA